VVEMEILSQIISEAVRRIIADSMPALHPNPINIGVSNRHIHLSAGDLEHLFGKGHAINCMKDLSQPGQCAAAETVIIAGPKGCIENVRVLGPVRMQTQIEVSQTDTYRLGIKAPVRESGNLESSGQVTVIGPNGSLHLSEGLIVAQRHIHMTPDDAKTYGVTNSQSVQVKVEGARGIIFDNVVVRVSNSFALEYHIDIDEANCAGIKQGDKAYLMKGMTLIDTHVCENEKCSEKCSGQCSGQCNGKCTGKCKEKVTDIFTANVVSQITEEPDKLVTEETVRNAWKKNATLSIGKGVICTPLARDAINELGMKVIWK